MQRNSPERKMMLAIRRNKQRNWTVTVDLRLKFFSKNSLPEYRKN